MSSNIRRTARAIIIKEGNVLLMERWRIDENTDQLLHYYSIIGGTIEPGETKEETLIRELEEEAGVKVVIKQLLAEQTTPSEHHDYFWCQYVSGEPQLNPDSPEAVRSSQGVDRYVPRFVPLSDLKQIMLHPVYQPMYPMLLDVAAGKIPRQVWQF